MSAPPGPVHISEGSRWHAMWAVVPNALYRCRRCGFMGTLPQAVIHAVSNQEDLR